MKSTSTLACVALAACALSATAAAEPPTVSAWGINPVYAEESIPFFDAQDFAFDRVATFTLDGRFDLLTQIENRGGERLNVVDGMVTLWRSNGDSNYRNDELIGGFDFGPAVMQQRFADLGSGSYFYLVEGVASGRGDLLFSASIAAVPEPSQWALMLAGLAAVGAFARRRVAA